MHQNVLDPPSKANAQCSIDPVVGWGGGISLLLDSLSVLICMPSVSKLQEPCFYILHMFSCISFVLF